MIDVSHITKRFGKKTVLDDISLQIPDGVVYGLIGYNGVGKTTLLKLMTGIYRPDAGQILMTGVPVYENVAIKQNVFLMTEELFFLPQATLADMEIFYRGYYPGWNTTVYHKMAEVFGLELTHSIQGFSKGMQRQAGLMTAFSSGCRYLFLDEAFDGLDLGIRRIMRQVLRMYVRDHHQSVVVLTSHNLDELEECADRFGMIREGRLAADLKVDEVREKGMSLEDYFLQEQMEREYNLEALFVSE